MKTVDFSMNTLVKLVQLDISRNVIHTISLQNRHFLQTLPRLELHAAGNEFPCSCKKYEIIRWLSQSKTQVSPKTLSKCKFENDTVLNVTSVDEIIALLKLECDVWQAASWYILCTFAILVLLSFTRCLYHQLWELKYLYYIGRKVLNPYHPIENNYVSLDLDVYISYDSAAFVTDGVTVHNVVVDYILPHLNNKEFSVKVREDITPGRRLSKEICDIIRTCKKTVVLLTPGYCSDYWNTFEFNISVLEGIYTRRMVTIPVIVGKIYQ